jgi:AraC-like DNA-binding protein
MIGHLSGGIHRSNAPHRLHADPPADACPGFDFYLLREGHMRFTDEHGDVELGSGDMILLRSDAELLSYSERFDMIAIGLPEAFVRNREMAQRWALGRRIPGGSGLAACLASLLGTAVSRHQDLTPAEATVLQTAVLDSILLLGSSQDPAAPRAPATQQDEKLSYLKTLAFRSLQVPELTPCAVAREGGVSTRTLHRLFNSSGVTFRSWLRDCRLERCWAELTDTSRRRATIAEVAFRWGFNDLRTFNRAFSARYRMTPQAARKTTQAASL